MDVTNHSVRRCATYRPYGSHQSHGFTLHELLIVLIIACVLLAIAAPDLAAMAQSSRMRDEINHLIGQLHYARSEAIKRNQRVHLCKSPDGVNCNTNNSVQWDQGWFLFADSDNDGSPDGEDILMIQPQLEKLSLRYAGSGSSNSLSFYPTGRTNNGTFIFCDGRGADSARAIIIFRSGRIRTSNTRADGSAIECP